MIADDFQLLREDVREALERQADMEVVGEAVSGREIVELAETCPHDLILMDIEMEQANAGILAAEKIREKNPVEKIIFLTVHETKEIILTAVGAGAMDYVIKGCTEEELLYHIRAVYDGHPVMQSRIHDTVMQEYSRLRKSERSLLFFINNLSELTGTERTLIKLLLQGYKVNEIAKIRCVEVSTVKTQIKGLLRKFGCTRTKQIVQMIQELNIEHLF